MSETGFDGMFARLTKLFFLNNSLKEACRDVRLAVLASLLPDTSFNDDKEQKNRPQRLLPQQWLTSCCRNARRQGLEQIDSSGRLAKERRLSPHELRFQERSSVFPA